MMPISLPWMRPDAPYMPIATHGLLAVLTPSDPQVSARWSSAGGRNALEIETSLNITEVAEAVVSAPLPDVSLPAWPTSRPQGLGPSLRETDRPLETFHRLIAQADGPERLLLQAIATDQVLTTEGLPSRTRLLRGAKSDLSAFAPLKKVTAAEINDELATGAAFRPGNSGAALGLVPELHTFGGTTGREPQKVGAESPLLSRLLRHGILNLPPSSGARRSRRALGGPLLSESGDLLSWPQWSIPCGLRELRALFSMAAVHAPEPNSGELAARGIDAVFRASSQQLSTTVAVFRWGRRVA